MGIFVGKKRPGWKVDKMKIRVEWRKTKKKM